MAFIDNFKGLFTKIKEATRAKMLNGYIPIFTQFGQDIYLSDVVQNCIAAIATEISKLQPRHIRTDDAGMQSTPTGPLNRLFKFAPNPLMTTREFLEKVVWLLYLNENAFVFPVYDVARDPTGNEKRIYRALYPLNPTLVEFLNDELGNLLIRFTFSSGTDFMLLYSDVIHIRRRFGPNDMMGGGVNGGPDHAPLLKVLQINDTLLQGLEKGVKTSMSVRGILKINTMMDTDGQKTERARLEKAIQDGDSGIISMDMKGDYTPLNIDPKLIDKSTLDFLDSKILRWYGVSLPIISGDYTDDQYQAFYEKTLEPIVLGLGQAFSKTIFTTRELDVGNEVVFYGKDMMYLSTNAKLNLLKTAGEQGLLTDNQKLAIIGYPPIEGGDRRTQSLNYVDTRLINAYQMAGKNTTAKGGDEDAGKT
ncbi:phage portal protein [Paenibacillus sp. MWE-103]|uniref:Phage portal protein n=1 Tax=Paenibacillus artemisiicola TaxID=1172618 RepID=A0ABS3WGA9_9BACL|nr:phage portal protein [Paenibacillus artemisiicola]MBO7747362.1 phage portal protein [Paenibacillus artemisiicola]